MSIIIGICISLPYNFVWHSIFDPDRWHIFILRELKKTHPMPIPFINPSDLIYIIKSNPHMLDECQEALNSVRQELKREQRQRRKNKKKDQ
jgi:hypothetical protein